ncbi:MFS transporter [Paenibacillus thermoaerophilus]|uniref:MFS transporter n=1 Tax=Paenibacillus thermoaerophilus TaxID=1215385 RepID=A0ABW2V5D0_9BACL|nr:MFS transporter [Paenibacillus thermoaerophilus]TMV17872.1 multidrug efflux MFS transporter [Paenibacillus thermoaerophilus]
MPNWKLNLSVLWLGQFLVMSGMTMVVPFLSLYLQELGMNPETDNITFWAGIIFAGNFVTSFLFQPIWGSLADRHGRKIMLLRSGFGMAIIVLLMGFAQEAWHLLVLRILNGVVSGFVPASVSLMSTIAPRDKMGFALGTLQSGGVAGTILGPLFGGLLAESFGYRPIFYLTGGLLFIASTLAWVVVTEKFDKEKAMSKPKVSVWSGFRQVMSIPAMPALLTATFLIQFAMLSTMPILPLFVQMLHGKAEHLAFLAGFVGSIAGFSNMIASPLLGRLGDRIGSNRVLGFALAGAALASIPQAFVTEIWQLVLCRFALGMFMGGLIPSVNTLVRRFTPDGLEGRAYSFNTSALALGNMLGPTIGGSLAGWIGIRGVFVMGGVMLAANSAWVWRQLVWKRPSAAKGEG